MAAVEIDDTALDAFLDRVVRADLERRAYNVENTAKRLMAAHGGGRVYTTRFWRDKQGRLRRGRPRPPHQASAPGQPASSDTGLAAASIHHEIRGGGTNLEARIGSDVFYFLCFELGTRYMAARPTLRPALRAAAD